MKKITTPLVSGVLLLVLFGYFAYKSLSYPYIAFGRPGAGFFPFWLCIFILALTIIYIYEAFKEADIDILPKGKELRDILYVFGAMLLFVILADFTGFNVASTLFLAMLFFHGGYKWYTSIAMGAAISICLFALFALTLGVALPVNDFGF